MHKYKLILFDLDGTLCNTDEMVVQSFFKLYEDYKPKIKRTREELYYFSGPPLKKTMENEFPEYPSEMMVKAFQKASRYFYDTTVTTYEGEIETLKSLKKAGYLLGIVTNKAHVMLRYSLDICHIKKYFHIIVSADDVENPKPASDGIFRAMDLLNIQNKEEVLYVGDNDIDYLTAKNSEVDAMLVTWGPRVLEYLNKAKYNVKSYQEMGDLLL